ncbi:MAG TPA: exo-alpha-sialidase [Bacteroidales bacterium]|nr:exo-alpha-sialidase [Bacteroidales bacterium]
MEPDVRKVRDIVIYEDPKFYCAFPSVVKRPNGELIVAFRRAPNRKLYGERGYTHTDPNSYLVLVRSKNADVWTKEPEFIYAHAFGGSQDPCLLQLRDKTLLCTSYGWTIVKPEGKQNLNKPIASAGDFVFLGGYLLRSENGGKNWKGPYYPLNIPPETRYNALGEPLPAYNRGALYEARDGRILWVVASSDPESQTRTETHLIVSYDKGLTWHYSCPVARDDNAVFNETSVYETPGGDIVAFLRTAKLDDQACIARSTDGGKSFGPWQKMGFRGHPLNALRLPDNRVLLTYGYRHEPYGIRARILNPECTDFETAPEIILRDDGGSSDIGYPWPVMLDKKRVLVVYYFNIKNGIRHIAGTILEIK